MCQIEQVTCARALRRKVCGPPPRSRMQLPVTGTKAQAQDQRRRDSPCRVV